jgi:hypothetical protein
LNGFFDSSGILDCGIRQGLFRCFPSGKPVVQIGKAL